MAWLLSSMDSIVFLHFEFLSSSWVFSTGKLFLRVSCKKSCNKKSLWKHTNHTAWIINMNHFKCFGNICAPCRNLFSLRLFDGQGMVSKFSWTSQFWTFQKSYLLHCVSLNYFWSWLNAGWILTDSPSQFKFSFSAPLLLLIICSIILYHMGYIFATVLFIAGSVCNFIIHRRVN